MHASAKERHRVLNVMTTLLLKYPRLLRQPGAARLTAFERAVLSHLQTKLDTGASRVVSTQVERINYVDRGPVPDGYSSLFARISGIRIVPLSDELLERKEEFIIARCAVVAAGRQIAAVLRCTEGEVASLEFGDDVSTFQALSRPEVDTQVRLI